MKLLHVVQTVCQQHAFPHNVHWPVPPYIGRGPYLAACPPSCADREKETARALAQQERAVLRMRHREGANGPPDDEELEYRKLLIAAGIDPATVADADDDPNAPAVPGSAGGAAADGTAEAGGGASATPPPPGPRKRPRPDLPRPDFPPPSLGLQPAWPPFRDADEMGGFGAGYDGLDDGIGSELLVCWSFLQSFADLFGVKVPSLEGLLAALAEGEESRLLADVHCALLRLLQADMEDAHDEKERIGVSRGEDGPRRAG